MNKRPFYIGVLIVLVVLLGACSKNAENEHLPEYCQTYAGFSATASRDLFELLDDSGYDINRFNYLSVISEIELEFEVDDPNREIDLGGIQCFQNLTSLSLVGRSFKDISEISALSNIQSIELRSTSVVSIDSFKNLSKINSLVISDTKTLQSVEGVGEMTKLTDLDLSDNGLVNIGELNALVNLQHLYLNDNKIVYFPSINQLRQLETLDISNNNIIQLGEDLSGLGNLITLNASHNDICDISTLDDLSSLEELDLSYNDLGCVGIGVSPDFDSLENAPNLHTLKLNNNDLTSIEGLRDRDISLEILHLQNNELTDITPISEYTGITELVLYNNNIVDIDDLSGMTGLTSINLSFNNIVDFSDLRLIPNLMVVDLNHNNISIIPDLSASWPNLSILDLSSNQLTDTSGIEGHPSLEALALFDNGLTEIDGISNLPELSILVIDTPLEPFIHPDLGEITYTNPNLIRVITNCFNATPRLDLDTDHVLDFGFTLGNNVEIYDSISGFISISVIDFDDMNISVINENSIQLPNLAEIHVENNNLTDIRFILGNPKLTELYISNNVISNLSVISGVTTDDLDDLMIVEATNIIADNDLLDAFIDLPSLEEVDLTNTSVTSFTNCFNDLANLIIVRVDSSSLESITNSFNNIYDTYAPNNDFIFDSGNIGIISNSFNGGQYSNLNIENQTPLIGATIIEDSFNDINVVGDPGIVITNNDFQTITNSFTGITVDILDLSDNAIETITDSLTLSTILALALNQNRLETVPSLNTVTSLEILNLSDNILTTVSFIEDVPDLISLDISRQIDTLSNYTLVGIDGINNIPTLTTFGHQEIGVTAIDGFRNIGLSAIDFSFIGNDLVQLNSISATSFEGTPLTTITFLDQQLVDLSFLDNLSTVTSLIIGINTPDLSAFSGLPMETTLSNLQLSLAQPISDFSYLANYDVLTSLTVHNNLVEIDNLNGLSALSEFAITEDEIISISNSFNDLPSFEPNPTYLAQFTNLTTITNSFDLYGSPDNVAQSITISGEYAIINSFNNVSSVVISNNELDVVPTFDTASFDNVSTITLESGDYTNYAFLNGYSSLESLTIETLGENIIDLVNDQITTFTIDSADVNVSTITVDLATTAIIDFTSLRNGVITFTSDAVSYSLTTNNADIVLNSTNVGLELQGTMNDVEVNGLTIALLSLNAFEGNNTTLNTPALATVSRVTTTEQNANNFVINSNETTLSIDVDATLVTINDNFATDYTLIVDTGNVILNNTQPDLTIAYTGQNLDINYATLESIALSGNFNTLSSSSIALDTVTLGSSLVTTVNLNSNVPAMSVGSLNADTIQITNDSLTSLINNAPSSNVTITTNNNLPLTLDSIVDGITLDGGLVPSITIQDTAVISTLDLTAATSMNTIIFGAATISEIELETNSNSVTISGSTASTIQVSGTSIDTLDLATPLSTITIVDLAATVNAILDVESIDLASTSFGSLTIDTTSTIGNLTISSSPVFATLNTNNALIDVLDITTGNTVLNVNAVNATSSVIDGQSLTTLTTNVGTNNLTIDSGLSTINVELYANDITFITNTSILSIDNSSDIATFNISAPNLGDILAGTATITNMIVTDVVNDLNVTGSNISLLNVTGDIPVFGATVGLTPEVVLNTSATGTITVDVSSDNLDITATGNTIVTGSNLSDITFNVFANNLNITLNQPALDAVLGGTANTVTVQGADIATLTLAAGTSIDTLTLDTLNIPSIDTTGLTVNNLDITTNLASFTVTSPDADSIVVVGNSLTSITVNNTNATGTLDLTTSLGTLDVNGQVQTLNITNDTATTIDLNDITVEDITLQVNSLATLNTASSVANLLDITTLQNNFNLTSDAPNIVFTSSAVNVLNLTSSLAGSMTIDTTIDEINFTASNSDITVLGDNLNTLNGTVNTLDVTSDQIGLFTVNVTASAITLTGNDSSITTNAELISINANTTADTTVVYSGVTALDVTLTAIGDAQITLQNGNAVTISGDAVNTIIVGAAIDTVTTTSLTVSNKYTMNDTLIDNITFASPSLLGSLAELEVNTLSNTNTGDIVTALSTTTITLFSPITDTDVYNYYYNTELANLVAQEAIDQVRYNALRATAVDDSWLEIAGNTYMNYLDETATKIAINTDALLPTETYFQTYLTNEGTTEVLFGEPASTIARNSIQATLDQIAIIMDETGLQNAVTSGIETDADTTALAAQSNATFTIG